jgi:two-component system alkaline phosphatase synthesis response regulator PhoP
MTNSDFKILIVDDEEDILELLSLSLKNEGYQIFTASSGRTAINIAKKHTPHLILLDVMMPEMDGIETCRELRNNSQFKDTVISFLTARNEDYSQIAGFESGADDYISKPIKPRVLQSRIQALLRRNTSAPAALLIKVGDITIDRERFLIIQGSSEFHLPKKEFELLELLMSKPGSVFTRTHILDKVWGEEVVVGDRTIDVHIRKLREKLGDHYIKTIKGVGYKFEL